MAKKIKEFPVSLKSVYNWDLWFNGQIWELRQGEDFSVSANSFRVSANYHAMRKAVKLKIIVRKEVVTMQVVPD